MIVYVDATPLYNLGMIGELDLLGSLRDDLVIPEAVHREITVEPASTNVGDMVSSDSVETNPALDGYLADARRLLGDDKQTVDATLVAGLLAERSRADDRPICGFVSDDRRLRRLADGLGASVTSTFGVVVQAAREDQYFTANQAKRVVRRMDNYGLVTTGPLRERAVGDVADGA